MLQRAAETVSGDDECNDPAVLLACALGSTGCPAKCADAEKDNNDKNPNNAFNGVVAGDLSVAVSTSTSVTSIPNSGVIKVASLAVKASEDIQLQSVDVLREGLSTNKDIKVWIEKDGRRITSSSSFFGDSKANLTFNNGGYVVKGDETLDLVVSLSGVAQWSELQFKLNNLVSSAKNSTISPDTTGLFRTANYQATSISFVDVKNNERSYNLADSSELSFGEFKLQNDSPASMEKDVLIKSITFKVDGSIENLTNFKLLRDSKEVSSKYTVDGKSLTFAVNTQLDSGKSSSFKVTAEVTNIEAEAGDAYTFSIRKSEDVIAEEIGSNATAYRVSVNGTLPTLGKTTIKGGNIILTKDSKLASTVSADWGYSDVTIAKGTIKVNQAVKFEKAYISGDATAQTSEYATGLDKVLRRATLVVDGKTYQAEREENGLKIDSEIYLSKGTHDVELQISLNNQAVKGYDTSVDALNVAAEGKIPAWAKLVEAVCVAVNDKGVCTKKIAAGTVLDEGITAKESVNKAYRPLLSVSKIKFQALDKDTFRGGNYTNGDETKFTSSAIAGNIRVSEVKVEEKVISIKKTGPSEDVKIAKGNTDEKVVLVWEISNTTDKVLEINKFNIMPEAKADTELAKDLWDVYVVLGNNTSSTIAVKDSDHTNGANIDSVTTTIEAGQSAKFEVRIIPHADLADGKNFRFKVKLSGKLDGNDTTSAALNSAYIAVNKGATTNIVANTNNNKLIVKPGKSEQVASFNYNVRSDSVDVETMELVTNGIDVDDIDSIDVDFGGSIGAPGLTYKESENWILITFNNIVTLPVDNHKVTVSMDFNESAIKWNKDDHVEAPVVISAVAFNPTGAWYSNDGKINGKSDTIAYDGAATMNFRHFIAKAYPILSVKDKNTTAENARLDIAVRKSNDDANTVTLEGIYSKIDWANSIETTNYWHVVDGANTVISDNSLDASSSLVIGSSRAIEWKYESKDAEGNTTTSDKSQKNIAWIKFKVVDDNNVTAIYDLVNAGSDFASLSL